MRIVWSRFSWIHKWCHIWSLHVHLFHYIVYAKHCLFSLYIFVLAHIVQVFFYKLCLYQEKYVWCCWISGIKFYMDSAFYFISVFTEWLTITCILPRCGLLCLMPLDQSNLQVGANRNDQRHCMHEPVLKHVLSVTCWKWRIVLLAKKVSQFVWVHHRDYFMGCFPLTWRSLTLWNVSHALPLLICASCAKHELKKMPSGFFTNENCLLCVLLSVYVSVHESVSVSVSVSVWQSCYAKYYIRTQHDVWWNLVCLCLCDSHVR